MSQIVGAMTALKKIAGRKEFLLVGDSKLISHGNVGAMIDVGVSFIAPAAAAKIPREFYAGLNLADAVPVDYRPERDAHLPALQQDCYRVMEDVFELPGRRKRDPVHRLRRILVHSTGNARGQAAARDKCRPSCNSGLATIT